MAMPLIQSSAELSKPRCERIAATTIKGVLQTAPSAFKMPGKAEDEMIRISKIRVAVLLHLLMTVTNGSTMASTVGQNEHPLPSRVINVVEKTFPRDFHG